MQLTAYHAKYFAYELTKRSSSDSMEKLASTLADAQVDINPHQVEAALFAFRSPLSKGAILADEVGLGKTIEAGLVIAQKWAEQKRRILIITPSNLRKQWSQELLDKFFLNSIILETKSFNQILKEGNLNPFDHKNIVICSYQFASSKDIYIKKVNWDLAVVDEAHRLRNVYKTSNKIARSIKASLEEVPKILLTATPLQNSLLELYGLVSIIDEYAFGDLKSFKAQYGKINSEVEQELFDELKKRLAPICKRTLRKQVLEYIQYTNRIALVEEFYPTEEETRLYNLVSEYLQKETLYALPASQRQLMTLILRKLLASSTFAISRTLDSLISKLEIIIQKHRQIDLELPFAENYEGFDELKEDWEEDDLEEIGEERIYSEVEIAEIKEEIYSLKEFADLAKSIAKNSKGEKLFTALENGFRELQKLGAPKKAIIFTESTRTQDYLFKILTANGYEGKIVLFNGSNSDSGSLAIYKNWLQLHVGTDRITGSRSADMRAALVDAFRDEATLMIATEAASEGVNLQFSSLVINYDLPWNPQRIEQRIGRCHRYGQKHDVVVVNFLNKSNAADERVYELLKDKFKLFDGVFGSSDEILGSIESGVDFEKRIVKIYQECRTREQIQTAFNQLQKELEESISNAMQTTRKYLLENFDEEVRQKLKINVEESKEYISRYENWLWEITRFFLKENGIFSNKEYSFTLNQNPFPEILIHSGPYKIGRHVPDINVYRINHPLAELIIRDCKDKILTSKTLKFQYTDTGRKISALNELIGKSGYLQLSLFTINSFESEDFLLLSGVTQEGEILESEILQKLFSLTAREEKLLAVPVLVKQQLRTLTSNQIESVMQRNLTKNSKFFNDEFDKLDKWAEDMKLSLEKEIKDIDAELKLRKAEARKVMELAQKVEEQRLIKELEKKRNEKRRKLFESQDEIDNRKEKLLSEIETRLKQKTSEELLFIIRWELT
jgi:ERCC4-related helicase